MHMGPATVCAIDLQGSLYCWGWNRNGEVGDGTTVDRWRPTPVAAPQQSFVAVSGSCALAADGTAFCWGYNGRGNVGDGTTLDRLVPTRVAGGLRFKSISTGNDINCGIAITDRVYCWGNGDLVPRQIPLPDGQTAAAVATSKSSVCVIAERDQVYCWGDNDRHELGDSTTVDRALPAPVMPPLP